VDRDRLDSSGHGRGAKRGDGFQPPRRRPSRRLEPQNRKPRVAARRDEQARGRLVRRLRVGHLHGCGLAPGAGVPGLVARGAGDRRSIPVRFGGLRSVVISRVRHGVAVTCLFVLSWVTPLARFYQIGVGIVTVLLAYEQSLVRADDLSQVKRAFDMNGYVGILYLLVLAASIYGG